MLVVRRRFHVVAHFIVSARRLLPILFCRRHQANIEKVRLNNLILTVSRDVIVMPSMVT